MAEWFYEDGIGEERAILVENSQIVAALIERHGGVKPGLVAEAQLITRVVAGTRGIVKFADGGEALLSPLPKGLNEGASLMVEVTRAAIDEKSRFKQPVVKAAPNKAPRDAPTLLDRIGQPVTRCHAHAEDIFEAHGWGELLEEARTGMVAFAGGSLQIALTPAMTLIDVDGDLAPAALALIAATAAAQAIRRLDLQGNIGIDFPTLNDKADRNAAAAAFDAAMAGLFERTAINGFGFMQILTRRVRQSIPELVQYRPILAEALALLRRAERDCGTGPMTLVAHPAVLAQIEAQSDWTALLAKRVGRAVSLHGDAQIAIGGGYVKATA
ncbi:MAG: ribonuclease [Sphingorhabdus sp.]